MGAAKKSKGTVGVIGLGIMGGAFAKNLAEAGWRVIGYDISLRAAARPSAPASRSPRRRRRVAGRGADRAHQPAQAAGAHGHRARNRRRQAQRKVIVEMSTFAISDKEKAERVLAKAGHAMLDCPVSGTGSQAARRDLVFYASGDASAIRELQADVRGLRPPRLRRRRLRQRQQDEIRRQPAGGDPQRRQRRSHGAGHEGRAAAAD